MSGLGGHNLKWMASRESFVTCFSYSSVARSIASVYDGTSSRRLLSKDKSRDSPRNQIILARREPSPQRH